MSSISRAARASATVMSRTSTPVITPWSPSCGASSSSRSDVQPDRMWSNFGCASTPSRGDERHVHVRALADVPVGVDEHAVVEAGLLRLHLHQHVGQVVGGLGDGVERRLDRIGRGHHLQAVGVPALRVRRGRRTPSRRSRARRRPPASARDCRARRQPVADRAVAAAAGGGRLDDDVAHLVARARQLAASSARPTRGSDRGAPRDRRSCRSTRPAVSKMPWPRCTM